MNVTVKEASKDDCVSDDAIYKLPILLHLWEKEGPLLGRLCKRRRHLQVADTTTFVGEAGTAPRTTQLFDCCVAEERPEPRGG